MNILQDLKERFLNFETVKGAYLLPAGGVICYVTLFYLQYVIQAFCLALGVYMMVEGFRKIQAGESLHGSGVVPWGGVASLLVIQGAGPARHAPCRGLRVPVATLVDLRHTARHGTTPWSLANPPTMRGTGLAA